MGPRIRNGADLVDAGPAQDAAVAPGDAGAARGRQSKGITWPSCDSRARHLGGGGLDRRGGRAPGAGDAGRLVGHDGRARCRRRNIALGRGRRRTRRRVPDGRRRRPLRRDPAAAVSPRSYDFASGRFRPIVSSLPPTGRETLIGAPQRSSDAGRTPHRRLPLRRRVDHPRGGQRRARADRAARARTTATRRPPGPRVGRRRPRRVPDRPGGRRRLCGARACGSPGRRRQPAGVPREEPRPPAADRAGTGAASSASTSRCPTIRLAMPLIGAIPTGCRCRSR